MEKIIAELVSLPRGFEITASTQSSTIYGDKKLDVTTLSFKEMPKTPKPPKVKPPKKYPVDGLADYVYVKGDVFMNPVKFTS